MKLTSWLCSLHFDERPHEKVNAAGWWRWRLQRKVCKVCPKQDGKSACMSQCRCSWASLASFSSRHRPLPQCSWQSWRRHSIPSLMSLPTTSLHQLLILSILSILKCLKRAAALWKWSPWFAIKAIPQLVWKLSCTWTYSWTHVYAAFKYHNSFSATLLLLFISFSCLPSLDCRLWQAPSQTSFTCWLFSCWLITSNLVGTT